MNNPEKNNIRNTLKQVQLIVRNGIEFSCMICIALILGHATPVFAQANIPNTISPTPQQELNEKILWELNRHIEKYRSKKKVSDALESLKSIIPHCISCMPKAYEGGYKITVRRGSNLFDNSTLIQKVSKKFNSGYQTIYTSQDKNVLFAQYNSEYATYRYKIEFGVNGSILLTIETIQYVPQILPVQNPGLAA